MGKILFVDDEPALLSGIKRQLYKDFDIVTSSDVDEAAEILKTQGPFAVIVSDNDMPKMDGIQFLNEVKQMLPDTIRIMLTGKADLESATKAVNYGHIFRFLTKPCDTEILKTSLTAALDQYRLIRAEKDILDQTLSGAIKTLVEILSLSNPTAFSRSSRIFRQVQNMVDGHMPWDLRMACLLSQIGCITLPEDLLQAVYKGEQLSYDDFQKFESHALAGAGLIRNIPRLDSVATLIHNQNKRFDQYTEAEKKAEPTRHQQLIKIALDFDMLLIKGKSEKDAMSEVKQKADEGWYDPAVLASLEKALSDLRLGKVQSIGLADLKEGMVLDEDVRTKSGTLLASKGLEVSQSMVLKFQNLGEDAKIEEPIQVRVPKT